MTAAEKALMTHFREMCLASNDNERKAVTRHRRLLRALLNERRREAIRAWAAAESRGHTAMHDAIYWAVGGLPYKAPLAASVTEGETT